MQSNALGRSDRLYRLLLDGKLRTTISVVCATQLAESNSTHNSYSSAKSCNSSSGEHGNPLDTRTNSYRPCHATASSYSSSRLDVEPDTLSGANTTSPTATTGYPDSLVIVLPVLQWYRILQRLEQILWPKCSISVHERRGWLPSDPVDVGRRV